MIFHSYPPCRFIRTGILFAAIILLVNACRKDTDKNPPALLLATESGFITDSAVVPIGFPYKIGIHVSEGEAAVTNLVVTLTTENGMETALDSGMYSGDYTYTRDIAYGASRYEKWSFMVRDKNGKSSNTSVTILKDITSAFGPIQVYPSVKLSTQNDPSGTSFFSFEKGISYKQMEAEANQTNINLITYFGDKLVPSTEFTLSSPGESDVSIFYPMISGWAVPHNETRYKPDSLSISQADFDAAFNDSIIITNYTSATIGKRKFKIVRAGYIIPFEVTIGPAAGKRGLISIKSMQDGPWGFIIADIKVQK